MMQDEFQALGTYWNIKCYEQLSGVRWFKVISDIHKVVEAFENTFSRFKKESLLSSISGNIGIFKVGNECIEMLRIYQRFYIDSNKLFTPLIGSLLVETGYDSQYSFQSKTTSTVVDFAAAVGILDEETIKISTPCVFDFGGVGKGFLIDKVRNLLEKHGVTFFSINAGGDLYCFTNDALSIGLEDPEDTTKVVGIASLAQGAFCASAGNRRKWDRYNHILDPHTRQSPDQVLATWVYASDTVITDALATMLFLVNPETLLDKYVFDYSIMYADRSMIQSPGMSAIVSLL